jgi:molybdate transport system permease protein
MPTLLDLDPFLLSLRVAGLATLLIVAAGVPMAVLLARGRFPGKGLVAGVVLLPLVLPPTVLGYVLLQVLGRGALLGDWLEAAFGVRLVFNWAGAVIASGVAAFPMFLVPARSAIEGVDPALEDAARLLGRGEWSVFASVTLPLAWRGIVAGAVLAFARALGDFGATLMVASDIPGRTRTASLAIYNAVLLGDNARAWTLTLLVAAVSMAALLVAQRTASTAGARR